MQGQKQTHSRFGDYGDCGDCMIHAYMDRVNKIVVCVRLLFYLGTVCLRDPQICRSERMACKVRVCVCASMCVCVCVCVCVSYLVDLCSQEVDQISVRTDKNRGLTERSTA